MLGLFADIEILQSVYCNPGECTVKTLDDNSTQIDLHIPVQHDDKLILHCIIQCNSQQTTLPIFRIDILTYDTHNTATQYTNTVSDTLHHTVQQYVAEQSHNDTLSLFSIIEHIQSLITQYNIHHIDTDNNTHTELINNTMQQSYTRQFYLFHHIYSKTKRKIILDTSKQYNIHGIQKHGKPGIIVIEGLSDNVQLWGNKIKRLTWQRCQLKHETTFNDSKQCKFNEFVVLQPLAGSEWPTMTQLIDYLTPLELSDTLRSVLGFKVDSIDVASDTDSNSETELAATADKPDTIPSCIVQRDKNVILHCNVRPNAQHNEIMNIDQNAIHIKVAAQPQNNNANNELVEYIAELLDMKQRFVTLISGEKSRNKIVCVNDIDADTVYKQLQNVLKQ